MKKKILCVLLIASMLFTNAGVSVFAQEKEMQTEESEECFELQEPEEKLETKEETAEETFAVEELEEKEVFSKGTSAEKVETDEQETAIVQTLTESVDEERSIAEELENEESDTENTQALEDNADTNDNDKSGTYENISWSIDENGKLTVEGTGDFAPLSTGNMYADRERVPWYRYSREIITAEIKVQGMTDSSNMFYDCYNLIDVDFSDFDSGNVTNMSGMFSNCRSLTSLDISHFNTENVTDMNSMFNYCRQLTSLDVGHFNTENVTNMAWMFSGCESLTSLDVSNFKTENVTDMGGMFSGCSQLASLDLSNFQAENVINMWQMFDNCNSLVTIKTPYNVNAFLGQYLAAELPARTGYDTEGNICTYAWYDPEGKAYASIPKGINESVLLEKRKFETITWSIDENGNLLVEGTGDFPEGTGESRIPWYEYRERIKTAEIKVQGMTDASYMFSYCHNLKEVDFSGFDTGNVTNMSGMFSNCYNLKEVDFSDFDTRNVTNMSGMFSGCDLRSMDLSSLDTGNVADMSNMFSSCDLGNMDLSSLDTGNVTNMSDMFSGCEYLINLDLSGFDTKNVTDMNYMFGGCFRLTNLNIKNFDTSKVTNMSGMFCECRSLTNLDLSGFSTENVTDMSEMFGWCSGLININVNGFDTGNVTDMSGMFAGCKSITNLDLSNFNMENVSRIDYLFDECYMIAQISTPCNLSLPVELPSGKWFDSQGKEYAELPTGRSDSVLLTAGTADIIESDTYEKITWSIDTRGKLLVEGTGDFAPSSAGNPNDADMERAPWYEYHDSIRTAEIKVQGMTDASYMFSDCYSLISLDLSGFNTESVTDMSGMFYNCECLLKLDLSGFNTENVTSMKEMFSYCMNLTSLDISGFNTRSVTDMSSMFSYCGTLTNINLGDFKTENVTSMNEMFSGCNALTSLNVSSFNTDSVTDMTDMFSDCEQLTSLDLSSFNTNSVTDMTSMFSGCSSLTDLDVSSFNTENVIGMSSMFSYCSSLTDLNVSSFNTENVIGMSSMFSYCSSLTDLDVSSFNTENVIGMSHMFWRCRSLTSLDLSSFDAGNVTNMSDMFYECDALTQIYTPFNVPEPGFEFVQIAELPSGTWYDLEGKEYTTLPIGKSATILLTKNKIPDVTAHITATKTKKAYTVGDTIGINDLKVIYYGVDGTVKTLQSSEYTTNISELDTSKTGEIILTITYQDMTANVKLTVSKKEESGDIEESASTEESSTEESGSTESSETEESSSTESSEIEESSSAVGGDTDDKDDSPYDDSERTDLASVNGAIANIKTKIYDKNEYEPVVKVTVTVNGKRTTLTEGADYRVLYRNNINAGTGTVVVRGNGIYKGELTKDFTISEKPVKKLKIVAGSLAGNITGNDLSTLPVYAYDGTKLLQLGTDYTLSDYSPVKATTATVTVNAAKNSNYTGSVTVKLSVYEAGAKIINPENVKLDKESVPYTGKAIKDVTPIVTVGGTTLTTRDYKVQYQNNKDAGTAFVIVTGKGEYKGKVVIPFTISAATSNPMTIKAIPDKTHNGKLQMPTVTVNVNSDGKTKKLSKNKDYKVVYENNFHAGKATVIVIGKGNYAGLTAEAEFNIKPQAMKKASIKGTQGNLTLMYSKRVLKEGVDYEAPVYSEPNKNKVTVTIKGMGDFTGEVTKKVKIN